MSRPIVLDLFSGPGCAALGFLDAGLDVLGVDVDKQPAYPGMFVQGDAIAYLRASSSVGSVAAIFADPPRGYAGLADLRERLIARGLPYVIGGTWLDLDGPGVVIACGKHVRGGEDYHAHRAFEPGPGVALVCEPCTEREQPQGRERWASRAAGKGEVRNGVYHPPGESSIYGWSSLGRLTDTQLAEGVPRAFGEWIGHALRRAVLLDTG